MVLWDGHALDCPFDMAFMSFSYKAFCVHADQTRIIKVFRALQLPQLLIPGN